MVNGLGIRAASGTSNGRRMAKTETAGKLNRAQIVREALELLGETGIEGLTMRALAKRLGISPPSLYWHFPSKYELLEDMADAIVAPVAQVGNRGTAGQGLLLPMCREFRAALLRYRDGAKVFAGTFAVRENVLRMAEILLGDVRAAGFSARTSAHTIFNLVYFILGLCIEEQAFAEHPPTDRDGRLPAQLTEFPADKFPFLHEAASTLFDSNFDERFELGLSIFLRGLDAMPRDGL